MSERTLVAVKHKYPQWKGFLGLTVEVYLIEKQGCHSRVARRFKNTQDILFQSIATLIDVLLHETDSTPAH